MSAISGFINSIRNAVYGEQVRSAIISALEQCYSDVNAPSLQTEAFATALDAAYAGGILDIQTVTQISSMTNQNIIYRYNGTEAGKQKGLYYYSALSSSWVLIGSEIHAVSLIAQMTDTNAIYKYTGTQSGMVQNSLYCYNGTAWVPIGSGVLTASTAAQMTNQNAIYKYTGSETGYNTNALYYYNGTGFVPISEGVVCDKTLTEPNIPADAEVVGNRIGQLDTLVIGQEGSPITSMTWSNDMPSNASAVGYTDTGANYGNRPISSLFGAEYQAIVKSIDENYPFVVVLYNGTEKVGLIKADGTIVSTVSDLKDYYDTQNKLIPYGYNAKIVIKGGAAADALSRIQVLNVSMGSAANAEMLVTDVNKLNDEVFGVIGEPYDGTITYSIGNASGVTDVTMTNANRLTSGFVSGKVVVRSNSENALIAVTVFDALGTFVGVAKSNGTVENTGSINATYYGDRFVIPAGRQGKILVKKATNGNFSSDEVETYSSYIDVNYMGDSLADKVTTPAVVGAAYPHLYRKKIAALGDSLLEWSNKWVMQSANRYQMESYIRGVGSQYWFCNSSRPNGAVYQVDTLVASDFVPDIVILEYGTNDVWSASGSFGTYETPAAQDATTSVGAMRYCIEKLQSTYPDCKILVILPMIRNNNGLEPTAQTTFRALAKQVLADYSVQWVDMYETSGIVYAMMNPDGIHLMKVEGWYRVEGTGLYKYADRVERALINL